MALDDDPIDSAIEQWAEIWGEDAATPMGAVASIMRVQQILLTRLNDELTAYDLTFPRYEALMLIHLSTHGALPIVRIGDRLQIHRSSAGALVEGLERVGLVRRDAHPTDRRTTLAAITDRGRDIATAATNSLNKIRYGTVPLQRDELSSIVDMFRWVRVNNGDFVLAPNRKSSAPR